MEETAQGALEYLLIIAGAILVAALVIYMMSQLLPAARNETEHELHTFLNLV